MHQHPNWTTRRGHAYQREAVCPLAFGKPGVEVGTRPSRNSLMFSLSWMIAPSMRMTGSFPCGIFRGSERYSSRYSRPDMLSSMIARATLHRLDSIGRKLCYSLHLLTGLGFVFSQPIDHGWWPAAKG